MRPGTSPELVAALAANGITTALMARLDFASGTVAVWTGAHAIQVSGSGDALLDGLTFDPFSYGTVIQISDNANSYSGSEPLTLALGMPARPDDTITAASIYPAEYQGRQATLWRAIQVPNNDPLAPPVWMFRRVRSGAMDKVEEQNDGTQRSFSLTIEGHAASITGATGASYMDQDRFDATDTSQRYAAASANGKIAPGYTPSGFGSSLGIYERFQDRLAQQ